jgi:hypothetical protein
MKGIEYQTLLGLIVVVAVIILVYIIVIGPAMSTSNNMNSRSKFEDFCVYWGLNGYAEGLGQPVVRDSVDHGTPEEHCGTVIKKSPLDALTKEDIDNCRKCCSKVIAC